MESQQTQTFLDVNAAAGELREVFTSDVTMATCQCNSCGKTGPLAESYVYTMQPGLIVRCNNCRSVLMRVVTGAGRAWLDLRGMAFLQLPMSVTQ